jgi:hypothetical protein
MFFHNSLGGIWLVAAIIGVIPFWRICTRIGWSPWLSLLVVVPLVNLIFIYVLAFSDWPMQKGTVATGGGT